MRWSPRKTTARTTAIPGGSVRKVKNNNFQVLLAPVVLGEHRADHRCFGGPRDGPWGPPELRWSAGTTTGPLGRACPTEGPQLSDGTSWRLARERISKEGRGEGAQDLLGYGDLVKFQHFFQKNQDFGPTRRPEPAPGTVPLAWIPHGTSWPLPPGGISTMGEGRQPSSSWAVGT